MQHVHIGGVISSRYLKSVFISLGLLEHEDDRHKSGQVVLSLRLKEQDISQKKQLFNKKAFHFWLNGCKRHAKGHSSIRGRVWPYFSASLVYGRKTALAAKKLRGYHAFV